MSDTSSLSERIAESLIITSTAPSSSAASAPSPITSGALATVKTILRQTMRITIADGRIFLGTFAGTDRLLNLLLVNTDEFKPYTPGERSQNPNGRYVGLVLVPWRLVVRAEAQVPGEGIVDPDPGVGLRGIVDRIDEYEEDEEGAYT